MDSPRDPKDKGPVGDDQFLAGIRVTGTAERPQSPFPLGAQRSRCSLLRSLLHRADDHLVSRIIVAPVRAENSLSFPDKTA